MYRKALQELIRWKDKPNRMPLLIEGARQVGKTWLMKEIGRQSFKKTVYLNFDLNPRVKEIFQNDINPRRIIAELEFMEGTKIDPVETLIIFDEIQECNRALLSLKYFCEEAPEYAIISAGSLLGVAIHQGNSFPVGKVETLKLYPLSFSEFLEALGEIRHKAGIEKGDFFAFHLIEADLITRLKQYYFIGGMPKAVLTYIETKDLYEVRSIQQDITGDFQRDFSKHINTSSIPKVGMIWESVPLQLAKEKRQFIYRDMKSGARSSQFEDAMYWLEQVGLIHKIHRVETAGLPLAAYKQEAFKLYLLDVGLLSAMAGLSAQNLADPNTDLFTHFRGALTEQFVLQELKTLESKPQIFYWENDRKNGLAEVDFVIQKEGEIIPIEAKAALNLQAKSLKVFMEYYKPKTAVRTSLSRFNRNKNLYDIPLYLIGALDRVTCF
ncbi:ATPase [Spirochaetia bacterium]|nr:ATPase [Spirochaetia bacterium]